MSSADLRTPPAAQIAKVRQLCSQAFYAYRARPSVNEPHRADWNQHFFKVITKIARFLAMFQVRELPAFIIAAVHQYNISVRTSTPFDAEAITLSGAKRLKYVAREDCELQYLPEDQVGDVWWVSPGA